VPLDAATAAVEALVAELKTALPAELTGAGAVSLTTLGCKVVEGWPQPEVSLAYPTVAVHTPSAGNRIRHAPTMIQRVDPVSPTDPLFDAYFSVATLELPVVVDVFAKSPIERSKVLASLSAHLRAELASDQSTLEVTAADYFGQVIAYWADGTARHNDIAGRILAHEWRGTLPLVAEVDEIVLLKATRLLELRSATVIYVAGTVPATAEQRTIFAPP
jgi:hypothetical protein